MKKVLIIAAVAATLMSGVTLFADDDDRYERSGSMQSQNIAKSNRALSGSEKMYQKECGSCHMAYQPQFLPQRSWNKMMKNLDNHFDVDASLDANDNKTILTYLTSNAGDDKVKKVVVYLQGKSVDKHLYKMSNSVASNETPLRISQTPYFLKKHRKIEKRLIEQKEVKSLANCTACHTTANQGSYSERAIKIPNYGRWED